MDYEYEETGARIYTEGVLKGNGKECRKEMGRSIGLIKKITCEGIRVILRSRISNILRFTDSKFRKERERGRGWAISKSILLRSVMSHFICLVNRYIICFAGYYPSKYLFSDHFISKAIDNVMGYRVFCDFFVLLYLGFI